MYEIDHVLIFSSTGAPEAERLIAFGLTEGSPNRHSGQGTANRRFFFDNAMLELLWVENPEEALSEGICRLGLWERWSRRGAGACPFGICYRPASEPGIAPPFKSWHYQPPYAPITIAVAVTSDNFNEPLLFYLGHVGRQARDEPRAHSARIRNLSSAVIAGSVMELTFDDGKQGLRTDFRPNLRLVIQR